MKRPRFMKITLEYMIDTRGFDDDVNWSDPVKVIEEQIDCVGLTEVLDYQPLGLTPKIKIEVPKSKGEGL